MNEIILRTESLKAFYILDVYGTQKIVKAVNDVTLDIRENEVYGIAGESGCGKTTLLKALAAAIEPPLRLVTATFSTTSMGKRSISPHCGQKPSGNCGWTTSPTFPKAQ
jgi:ABC-type glutathione transport system ATPase component